MFICNRFLPEKALVLAIIASPMSLVMANQPPVLDVEDRTVDVGEDLEFVVFPIDADGVVPDVYLKGAPNDALFRDNGDGTRTFSWQPEKQGEYSIDFVVQDARNANLKNTYNSKITVLGSDQQQIVSNSVSDGNTPPVVNQPIEIGQTKGDVTKILSDIPVSNSQLSTQQTSVATQGGYVYTANIEPGPNGDTQGFELRTVLRQGKQREDQTWEWQSVVVDDRTLFNKWHTAPAVGVDKTGRIHVAYNMHNFPWQYKASVNAHDIYSLKYKGQYISDEQIRRAVEENRTTFPTLGKAEIPGNQITYPAFYKDKNQDLYVSYRFAAAPKRKFADRIMSSGVAVYNVTSQTWASIGGNVPHQDGDFDYSDQSRSQAVALAGKKGWTSYLPKLSFDRQNNMVASFLWREGTAGEQLTMPCVLRTTNRIDATDLLGNVMQMPISPYACGTVGVSNDRRFYTIGSFALSQDDTPYLLLSPTDGSRFISHYSQSERRWVQEKAPESATEIFFDNDNNMYAVASGIKIFKRTSGQSDWVKIYDEGSKRNCYPKAKKDEQGTTALIHTQSCDGGSVSVYGLRLH